MTSLHPLLATLLLSLASLGGCGDDSPEKYLADAKQSLHKQDNKAAVIQIKNALQRNPGMGEARAMLGSALLAEGNPVAAEVELRKALAAGYSAERVAPDLAAALLWQGQWKKVVDEFAPTHLSNASDQAGLQLVLASAYANLNQPERAQASLAAALAADPNNAPALLADARQKAGAGKLDSAFELTERVLAAHPDNADAWKFRGDLFFHASNNAEEALKAYRKALDANLTHMPSHAAILTVLLQQGNLDAAATQLEALRKFAAQHPQTRYFEAQLAFFKDDYKLAREIAQQLLQQLPNNPRILQLAGAVEMRTGQLAQASVHLSQATQLAPELPLARRLLIRTYLQAGQADRALAALNAAAAKANLEPDLYALAGEVYLQNGDAKKAEEYFAKALTLDPANGRNRTALAISRMAGAQTATGFSELENIAASDKKTTADLALISLHLRRNELDKALAAIDRLESKQPELPGAANLRGRVLIAKKDRVGARNSFERALSIDPSFFSAAASLAALDVEDNKPQDAKRRFENLLAKDPRHAQALLSLAQLATVGRAEKAEVIGLLTRAIDANATEVAPRLFLIEYLLRNGDANLALAAAQAAVAAVPDSADLLAAVGRAQQVSGDINQAVATYNKLVESQPLSSQAHIRLAEAHTAGKNFELAEQSLRKALEIKPDAIDAQRGLILLHLEKNDVFASHRRCTYCAHTAPQRGIWLGDGRRCSRCEQSLGGGRGGLQVRAPIGTRRQWTRNETVCRHCRIGPVRRRHQIRRRLAEGASEGR